MNKELETTLDVTGMGCPSCVGHINEALVALTGVSAVNVRLREGRVVVRHRADEVSAAELVAALGDAGYTAVSNAGR